MEPDELKGKVKEKVGQMTGDDRLRAEGKVDQAAGAAKGLVSSVSDKVKGALRDRKARH